ncbi:TetR/AcrR family transcriptional regulator [Streptomyces sp. DSM 42041]|uniref:TetR/AcrR family transcriptional regulator n=1 Tax=Streptomyces hazeniae TaxID=3075538 RepID=A0ABU2NNC0_9ACTN|nr:TetR/AcrR family transcriptional regulator [Streptomyces sp. DSM 42041]MDT0378479.1 TetR/AcrR family transcriptional regulator [Streptomyces sp. DSM 42041]
MPKKVDRARRREEILAAAVRVFARRGYAAARIDDVAREAGIAKGSVYLYFDGRESLLHAAFEDVAARSAELLREAAEGDGTAAERLAALVRGAVTELSADRDLARVLLDIWAAGRDADSPVDMAAAYRDYRAAVAALLEQARAEQARAEGVSAEGAARAVVTPDAHAAVVVGALEGCLLQWLFDPAVDPAALAEPLVRLLVPGAGAGAGAGAGSGSGGDGPRPR